jgi:hypothetical protein
MAPRITRTSSKALVVADAGGGKADTVAFAPVEPKDRNGIVERDFMVFCLTQLTDVYNIAPLSERQMQAFLDLFRSDGWINRHFQAGCLWAVRNCTRFPSYADFVRYRREEGLDQIDD